MINAQLVQRQIEKLKYWDSRVICLESKYIFDEITLIYEFDKNHNIKYTFFQCYKSLFNHSTGYWYTNKNQKEKEVKSEPIKELNKAQSMYFLQNINVDKEVIEGQEFYKFNIHTSMMELEILCKECLIEKINIDRNDSC